MALPGGDRRCGSGGRRAVPGVLRGLDRQRADAGGVRAGRGAVPVVVFVSWPGLGSAPTVKRHLAAIRVLCDWLVIHQVLPANPAAAVRGPKHVVTKGATPVLTPAETRSLLDGIVQSSATTTSVRAPMRYGVQWAKKVQTLDASIAQEPVHLLDAMLGQRAHGLRQAAPHRMDCQRRTRQHAQGGVGQ